MSCKSPALPDSKHLLIRASSDEAADSEFPLRSWEISIYLMGPDGEELPATCFDKATYHLHESFGKRQKQST